MSVSHVLHTIFLIAALQGISMGSIFAIDGFFKRNRKAFLGIFLASFSMILLSWVGFWTGFFPEHRVWIGWGGLFAWFLGPSMYIYYRNSALKKSDGWHLLPFLLNLFSVSQFHAFHQGLGCLFLDDATLQALTAINPYMPLLKILVLLGYAAVAFPSLESRGIKRLPNRHPIFFSFIIFVVGYAAYYAMVVTIGYVASIDYLLSLMMAIGIYGLSYKSQLGYLSMPPRSKKYHSSQLGEQERADLLRKIQQYLTDERPYLDATFQLAEMAEALQVPKYRISQTLNSQGGQSFWELVNQKRVEEAKKLILSPKYQHLKIAAIGEEVGFRNKVSFYNYFKKYVGISPGQFRAKAGKAQF